MRGAAGDVSSVGCRVRDSAIPRHSIREMTAPARVPTFVANIGPLLSARSGRCGRCRVSGTRPRRPLPVGLFLLAMACGPAAPAATTTIPPTSLVVASGPPTAIVAASGSPTQVTLQTFDVPKGSGPHDVAPAVDGGVWYTAQLAGKLGWLDPKTGQTKEIPLGAGSAPHGVIVGPDGAPWITDGGLNAIVRVDPKTNEISVFRLPGQNVNLNTAVFDVTGKLWWTGQDGWYGSLNVGPPGSPGAGGTGRESNVGVYQAPRGAGPYGITAARSTAFEAHAFAVYYASLAGSYLGRVDIATGETTVIEPPTKGQGARRAWSDSTGVIWVSEWNAGQLGRYDPKTDQWKEWKLPGARPMAYAVYVDGFDVVWLTDWGANALVRFDPRTEAFTAFPFSLPNANVRQLLGRPGEVWGAMSGQDKLVVARI